jgi:hypothetical protein
MTFVIKWLREVVGFDRHSVYTAEFRTLNQVLEQTPRDFRGRQTPFPTYVYVVDGDT